APMQCSKLLHPSAREGKLTHVLDKGVEWLAANYQSTLRLGLKAAWLAAVLGIAVGVGASVLGQAVAPASAPDEDHGQFNAQLQAPEGIGFEQMVEAGMKAESYMLPYFDSGVIQRGVVAVPGWGNASGIVNVTLRPWDERTISTDQLLQELNQGWSEIPE